MKTNKRIEQALELITRTDVYKTGHKTLYPKGLEVVFSNFTPRSENWAPIQRGFVISVGVDVAVKELIKEFNEKFFSLSKKEIKEVAEAYALIVETAVGVKSFDASHWIELWKLKYLPLEFRAREHMSKVAIGTPVLTIHNTDKRFAWLVNYLETTLSSKIWPTITAATRAYTIKMMLLGYAKQTGTDESVVDFQAHDFSYRGLMGTEAARLIGRGHLSVFSGSDTLPSILNVGGGSSVIATEHSIMSSGTERGELDTYKRLLLENPNGILSIVSDTWNIYKVCGVILPKLKSIIEERNANGKLVIRPDSGDPVEVLFGTKKKLTHPKAVAKDQEFAKKGLFKIIEEEFGCTKNKKGFKVLPITFLWGDGMTEKEIKRVYDALASRGYASENLFIGVGSYTYQLNTRDTYGFAMKATYVEIDGKGINISKDPITDNGIKKSATGLLVVNKGLLKQKATWSEVASKTNDLKVIK